MKRHDKRPILLLEVLIALALVALAAIPLLAPQVEMIRSERRFLNEIEADRIANLVFADLVEMMYQNSLTWESITGTGVNAYSRESIPKKYKVTYQFAGYQGKPDKEAPRFALFDLVIEVNEIPFKYQIFVEKEQELATPPAQTDQT